jgi:hypothetical protein
LTITWNVGSAEKSKTLQQVYLLQFPSDWSVRLLLSLVGAESFFMIGLFGVFDTLL